MKKSIKIMALLVGLMFLSSCSKIIEKTIENNPEILFKAIKKEPKKFFDTLAEAQSEARKQAQEEMEQQANKEMEEEFGDKPKKPHVDEKRAIIGDKSAPITIVEYSDFLCPHCSEGAAKMEKLMAKYPGKIRILYKHLAYKKYSDPASRYYEAIALKDTAKAKKFHDEIFKDQGGLYNGGIAYLDKLAKKVGADLNQIKKDMKSDIVNKRMTADRNEAREMKIEGTPGFIINGVSVRGNYPFDHFVKIIDRHLAKK